MTEGPGAKDAPHPSTDEERAPGQDSLSDLGERDPGPAIGGSSPPCGRHAGRGGWTAPTIHSKLSGHGAVKLCAEFGLMLPSGGSIQWDWLWDHVEAHAGVE
jgi:hypothetical protein